MERPFPDSLSFLGEVAQLVEHTTENRGVAGSIPALATWRTRSRPGLRRASDSQPASPTRSKEWLGEAQLGLYWRLILR